jgi:hypothetical protein
MKDLTDFTAKESPIAVSEGKMPVRQIGPVMRIIF